MKIVERALSGVFEIKLAPRMDERGFFMRLFDEELFSGFNLNPHWPQENHSRSTKKNIIRGLHFYLPPHDEAKLVRVIRGRVFDVLVDLRKESPTFGCWDSLELYEDDYKCLYIPRGFAHGFCTMSDCADVIYKHGGYYESKYDSGISWNDPDLKIGWPVNDPILSEKDKHLMSFKEFCMSYGGL